MVLIFEKTLNSIRAYSYRFAEKFAKYFSVCLLLLAILLAVLFIAAFAARSPYNVYIVYVDIEEPFPHVTDEKFLSLALDSLVIANGLRNFDIKNPKLEKLLEPLSPAYVRIGGNLADRLIFSPDDSIFFKYDASGAIDGGECSYTESACDSLRRPNYTMSGKEWLSLQKFFSSLDFDVIFDLNVLKRFRNGSWDHRNAFTLINFSAINGLHVNWELGNEPDAFKHQFNKSVSATQLAKDFGHLRRILNTFPLYSNSLLVGPDVTRPRFPHNKSMKYLAEFLAYGGNIIDAVTWHQYYFSGKDAKPYNYVSPETFNVLKGEIEAIKSIVESMGSRKPIWLGETADAWGGGSLEFSDSYLSTFIWLDKLGLSAKMGLDVVVRQSIVEGHYALLDKNYNPNPSWWLSVLYKQLVGPQVLKCHIIAPPNVRLYCHCGKLPPFPNIIVFGVNLGDTMARIRIQGNFYKQEDEQFYDDVNAYVLSPYFSLLSKKMRLNRVVLKLTDSNDLPPLKPKTIPSKPYVILPPFSSAFWVIPATNINTCKQ